LLHIWRKQEERRNLFRVLSTKANEYGIDLVPLKIKEIPVHEGVRLKCLVPQCEYYGNCRICPPNLPPLNEIRAALKYFSRGYLAVLKCPAVKREEADKIEMILLEAVGQMEKICWTRGYYRAMGLVVGGCKLCPSCAPLGEPCRHPYRARPSPEGLGIDLTLLARKKNIPLQWPPEKEMVFLGLLVL
jgi:predicted metal-binding protein